MTAAHDSGAAAPGLGGPVLVVDDDAEIRVLVSRILGRIGVQTVEAADGGEAFAAVEAHDPTLVLLDVRLPDVSGYELCRELRERFGDGLPIILASAEKTDGLDRSAGLLLGADDYLVKPFDPDELRARVRRLVSRGRPEVTAESTPATGLLTPREVEILELLAAGRAPAEIARELVISPKTVATHLQRILAKLGVHSQAQAVAHAYRAGLVRPAERVPPASR